MHQILHSPVGTSEDCFVVLEIMFGRVSLWKTDKKIMSGGHGNVSGSKEIFLKVKKNPSINTRNALGNVPTVGAELSTFPGKQGDFSPFLYNMFPDIFLWIQRSR